MSRSSAICYGWLLALALLASTTHAANDFWDGNGLVPPVGVWSVGANWVDNTTPGNSDTANFNIGSTYPVTFNADPLAIQALTVSAGSLVFQSSGGARTLLVNSATGGQDVTVSTGAQLILGAAGSPLSITAGDDLLVQSGAILQTRFGSKVIASDLSSVGLNGTIIIDGSGSTLTLNGAALESIGSSGTGVLSFSNGSTGNSISGALGLAISTSAGTSATLSITDGSSLVLGGNLSMANQNAATNAALNINGAGSLLTQSGASTTTVGATTNSMASINIGVSATGGTLTTGTGTLTIKPTGTVTVGSGTNAGTLNASGNVTLDGGVLERQNAASAFTLASGKTLSIQNGGRASFTGDYTTAANAIYTIGGVNSKLETLSGGTLNANNGGQINVSSDGLLSVAGNLAVGDGSNGNLSIAGANAAATIAGSGTVTVGHATTGTGTINIGVAADGGTMLTGPLTINHTGTVTVGSGTNVATLNADGNVTINGGNLNVGADGRFNLFAGRTFTVADGGQAHFAFGYTAADDATYVVTDTGSDWTIAQSLGVGDSRLGGTTTLAIESGGTVSAQSTTIGVASFSSGAVTVTGAGSSLADSGPLTVGYGGGGTLLIGAGGRVSDSYSVIASGFLIGGFVTVTGAGSSWTNSSDLYVGDQGLGELSIEAGGSVSNVLGEIAFDATSTSIVTVSGNASSWTNSGELHVGDFGAGTLTVQSGGTVSNTIGVICKNAGSIGNVTVTGHGSTWTNSGDLIVGGAGTATLTIADQGAVVVGGSLSANAVSRIHLSGGKLTVNQFGSGGLDALRWSSGTLRLTGVGGLTIDAGEVFGAALLLNQNQTLEVDHALSINDGGTLFAGGGLKAGSVDIATGAQLFVGSSSQQFGSGLTNHNDLVFADTTVVDGPVTNTATGAITALGNVTFNDAVSGAGGFYGPGTITFNGDLSPGASPADVSFEGNIALAHANTLFIELGGTTPGSEYDQLMVAGSATLDGLVDVSLINGFMPFGGQQFTILTAGNITNNGLALAAADASLFNLIIGSTSVILQAIGLPGDYNQNGIVDTADYVVWRKNQGTTNTLPNDLFGGTIGAAQYDQWRTHFGQTAGSGAGATTYAAVPEPATLVMFIMGITVIYSRRRAAI